MSWTSVAALGPRIVILFAWALLFALVEIEIEGEDGWAEKLPTWYRVRPWYARLYAAVMSGKPLTGYHAVMFVLPLLGFHIGFAFGAPWSWAAEAKVVAAYLVWSMVWDYLWFALNPAYGWGRFRAGQVWWHKTWWGPLPADYVKALFLSSGIAALPALGGDRGPLYEHLIVTATLVAGSVACTLAAPVYMRWYQRMRRPGADERALALPVKDERSE